MKNLAKVSVLVTLLALSVVFFYSQTHVGAAFFSQENVNVLQQVSFEQQNDKVSSQVANVDQTTVESTETVDGVEPDSFEDENETAASKAMSFSATCYCLKGKTASGAMVRRGIVAADPRVLPLGTRISVSGSSHSGTYLVADTGGVIKGRIIDIWVPSCGEAVAFGRRKVTVTILGRGGKKASDTKKVKKDKVKPTDKKVEKPVVKPETVKESN
jgi:3D (Asp-Asp-Asp) domain-containing protein